MRKFLNNNIMIKKDLIEEAQRYVDNARQTLRENGEYNPQTNRYEDPKYVRAAGHYLWHAVFIALDSVFDVRKDRRTRIHFSEYQQAVAKRDHKLLDMINDGYNILHLNMGYDGIQNKRICDEGFLLTNTIIDRCANLRGMAN